MIIIEGVDGAGKTTLIKKLQREFGFEVGQRGVADRKLLYTVTRSDTWGALSTALRGDERPLLWDRLYFSELVYADIVGRPIEFSVSEQLMIYALMKALHIPTIVCMPPLETVKANALKDDQMDGVNSNIAEIYGRYKRLTFPADNVLYYDYTGQSPRPHMSFRWTYNFRTVCEDIEQYLGKRKAREW